MRSFARILTIALALTIGATGLASPAGAAAGFGDVEADRWYTEPIAWLVSEGITTGTSPGCFSPQDAVTRGQIVTFLFRLDDARGNDPRSSDHPFVDVRRSYQHTPVGWAFRERITNGTSPTTFAPDDNVTRGDFAVLLWRYADEPGATDRHPFEDITRDYQHDAISWMAENRITTGTSPTTFNPDGLMTRAEAATFFFRFVGEPGVSNLASTAQCLEQLERFLVTAGLSAAEADCVAPFLADLDLDYLLDLIEGLQPVSGELVQAVAEIIGAGCIAPARQSTVVAIFT